MNALELVNYVLLNIDYPGGDLTTISEDIMGTRALSWLNTAHDQIITDSISWPWLEAAGTITLVSGTALYSLGATFDIDGLKGVNRNSDGKSLDFISHHEFDKRKFDYSAADSGGNPCIYTIIGTQIKVWPTPTAAGTLDFVCYKLPVELVDDDDIPQVPVKFHRTVLGQLALSYAKLYLGDSDLITQQAIQTMLLKKMRGVSGHYRERVKALSSDVINNGGR